MSEFEFSDTDNQHIQKLRQQLLHIAVLFLALGVVQLVGSVWIEDGTARWVSVGAAFLLLALGWLFMRPLDNFRRITTTKGQDVRQIIIAMKDLRAAFLGAEVIFGVFVAGIIVEIMRIYSGAS